jgi:hypothetical protein
LFRRKGALGLDHAASGGARLDSTATDSGDMSTSRTIVPIIGASSGGGRQGAD